MKKLLLCLTFATAITFTANAQLNVYHPIIKDNNGVLVHWYNPNHGTGYDHCLGLIWNFWKNMDTCCGGYPHYMIDHSYSPNIQGNKLGGDQFAMALSSWSLYYAYTGDTDLVKNMVYIADHYLSHSLSNSFESWPSFPYPCNYSNTLSANYDGDFLLGAGWTQPDKGGSFANELVSLYKITGNNNYLQAATSIANTLADKVQPGSATVSPYPFKVNAADGTLPGAVPATWHYTASLVPTLRLFEQLKKMNVGNTVQYDSATAKIIRWVKAYPLQNNEWGSFFEDIPVPSNTEINAVSMAWYILEHPAEWGNTWQQDSRSILDWTLTALGSHAYDTLGVTAIYEQSADLKEAGSHTSRFASIELLYSQKTGDTSRVTQALRQLDWANYLCDTNGIVRFTPPSGAIWFTDGYGDYVKHFLRAMAAYPAVAPDSANHLLQTSSTITYIQYLPNEIHYSTFDNAATETLKLTSKPLTVKAGGTVLNETSNLTGDGFKWTAYPTGGVLTVRHDNAKAVDILWAGAGVEEVAGENILRLYPNPAKGRVQLQFAQATNGSAKIELSDVNGLLLKQQALNLNQNNAELNIADLPAGVYFMQVTTDNKVYTQKLVVAR